MRGRRRRAVSLPGDLAALAPAAEGGTSRPAVIVVAPPARQSRGAGARSLLWGSRGADRPAARGDRGRLRSDARRTCGRSGAAPDQGADTRRRALFATIGGRGGLGRLPSVASRDAPVTSTDEMPADAVSPPSPPDGAPSRGEDALGAPDGAASRGAGALAAPDGAPSRGAGALAAPDGAPSRGDGALAAPDGAPSRGDGALAAPDGAPSRGDGALAAPDGAPSRGDGVLAGRVARRAAPVPAPARSLSRVTKSGRRRVSAPCFGAAPLRPRSAGVRTASVSAPPRRRRVRPGSSPKARSGRPPPAAGGALTRTVGREVPTAPGHSDDDDDEGTKMDPDAIARRSASTRAMTAAGRRAACGPSWT